MNSKAKLIKERSHKCEKCNNTEWLNNPIPLERHHIDGNTKNNDSKNLQLLCPNCHASTPNYRGKNIKIQRVSRTDEEIIAVIPNCQSIKEALKILRMNGFGQNYTRIKQLMLDHNLKLKSRQLTDKEIKRAINQRRIIRPSRKELSELVWKIPTIQVAEQFNVSDKAIENWCKFYDIPKPPRGYWAKKLVPSVGVEPT